MPMTRDQWKTFADYAELVEFGLFSRVKFVEADNIEVSAAIRAASLQLQKQQEAILHVRDSLLQFGYYAVKHDLHEDERFEKAMSLLDGCGKKLDDALDRREWNEIPRRERR